ncbi:SAGA complex, Sgf11 subunit [Ceraceosorus bombacis]|uniref:SAGA-associated factor 11 n=1 Tax=Ceraceosorus bombacis TaxID=401625 RepID=A0A0P1BGL1_9BASI|nr:SAGA complex, Sgf11 subunit [Ceraceosorus bombacis]
MPSKVARRTSSWATSSSGGAGGATASHSATAASNGAHRRESSDAKTALVSHFFAELLHEAIVDTASEVHATLARQRAIRLKHERGIGDGCPACGTATGVDGAEPSTATSGAIPLAPKTDLYSNNPLLPCAVCARQVGSNRYAMHLSKCLNGGSGKASQRRKVALGASVKESAASIKQAKKVASALEARKRAGGLGSASGTPAPGISDNESERTGGGGGAWLNGNGKRGASPNGAASSKKARTSSTPPLNGSNGVGMSRTSSSNHLSATPISGSPLNPKKYQKNVLSGSGADGAFAKGSSHGKAASGVCWIFPFSSLSWHEQICNQRSGHYS